MEMDKSKLNEREKREKCERQSKSMCAVTVNARSLAAAAGCV